MAFLQGERVRNVSEFSIDDVHEAAIAMRDIVIRTPLLENPDFNARLDGRLLIKPENLQRTGAFKIRGAYNRIRQMTAAEKSAGAITYSSGNHALGVALAARLLGTTAVIVMPSDAPSQKFDAVRELGAEVATFDRDTQNYNEVVAEMAKETGRVIVPPSGDERIHAGAATAALEIIEQCREMDVEADAILVPCGGGGLTSMTAFVADALSPGTQVYAVEPENFDDTRRSLEAGERVGNKTGARTICDAIMTPIPNPMTFEINKRLLAGGLVVSDDDVMQAMRFIYDHFRLVVEPGGAVGVAAVLSGAISIRDKSIVAVATGGNIAIDRFAELVRKAQTSKE